MRKYLFLTGVLSLAALAAGGPLAFLIFDARLAQPGRLPDGWRIKVTRGDPDVTVIDDPQGSVLHLKSRSSSFALERGLDIDLANFPYLTWKWKVTELPRAADFRRTSTDDQAAQVFVAFADRRILTYIWDTSAPKGAFQSASSIPLVHIWALVCRSGPSELNRWLGESRDVAQDYERAYGRGSVPRIKGVRLQINSQHTGSAAESYFGEVAFRSTPQ